MKNLVMILLLLSVACLASADDGSGKAPAESASVDTNRLTALMGLISKGDYKQRVQAVNELLDAPVEAVAFLKPYLNADDPELRLAMQEVVTRILANPDKVPVTYNVFTAPGRGFQDPDNGAGESGKWLDGLNAWRKRATVSVSVAAANASTSGLFAQGFVPKCDRLQVVELGVYPIRSTQGLGWIKAEICADENGKPCKSVLSRCWVRIGRNCPVPHAGTIPFVFNPLKVDPGKKYWICFSEYGETEGFAVINFTLGYDNPYADGDLLRMNTAAASKAEDTAFKIISQCDRLPGIREAKLGELKTIPSAGKCKPWW